MKLKIFSSQIALICAAGISVLSAYAHAAADPNKVIRVAFPIAETSFDNAFASDEVSQSITERIFEPMLEYDYLARPLKLAPRTLAKMPDVTDGGKTITATLQKGIYFSDDPAFGGKPRELIAADYAYSLKRLMDPKVKSPWSFLVENKVVGDKEARAAAQKAGKFDYDAPMAGLEVVDRYTLRIKLNAPDFNFLWMLAMPSTGAIAREVVEKYGEEIGAHPVGTGAYMLGEYKRSSKIVLLANPKFRATTWQWKSDEPGDQGIIKQMTGKPVPSIGRVEIYVIEEGQARWLAFLNGEHDYLADLPPDSIKLAKDGDNIKPELAARGLRLIRKQRAGLYYEFFNMNNPMYGGYTKEKIALRRAIASAFPVEEFIRVVWNGDGEVDSGIVPNILAGFNPNRPRTQSYDPELAKALLDRFGYKDRDGDGYRDMPDGSPLVIDRITGTTALARQTDELWKRSMDAIGVKMTFNPQKTPDRRKAAREGKSTMMTEAWLADYPDADNFLQLLWSKNIGAENYAQFNLKAYDERYEKVRAMQPSLERNRLIDEMQDLVAAYAPWINFRHDIDYLMEQPWFVGFRKHPIAHDSWEYADIDLTKKPK